MQSCIDSGPVPNSRVVHCLRLQIIPSSLELDSPRCLAMMVALYSTSNTVCT